MSAVIADELSIRLSASGSGYRIIFSNQMDRIAMVKDGALARLFAASPDLLAAVDAASKCDLPGDILDQLKRAARKANEQH